MYGHDSKSAIFSWSRRTFYILRTYAYDAWKSFYGLLKSQSSPKPHTEWGAGQSFRDLNLKIPLESHFSFNKKYIVCRTVTIQLALRSPHLGKCFTYSERLRTTHEKFSTGFRSQMLCQKPTQNYPSKSNRHALRLFKVHLDLKNHQKTSGTSWANHAILETGGGKHPLFSP